MKDNSKGKKKQQSSQEATSLVWMPKQPAVADNANDDKKVVKIGPQSDHLGFQIEERKQHEQEKQKTSSYDYPYDQEAKYLGPQQSIEQQLQQMLDEGNEFMPTQQQQSHIFHSFSETEHLDFFKGRFEKHWLILQTIQSLNIPQVLTIRITLDENQPELTSEKVFEVMIRELNEFKAKIFK